MKREGGFDISGIRFTKYTATDDIVNNLKNAWQSFVKNGISQFPTHFSGKGIVLWLADSDTLHVPGCVFIY